MNIEHLITDLERQVQQLERGQQPSSPVDREQYFELEAVERAARDRSYRLNNQEMITTSQIGPVFAQQVAEMGPEELTEMLHKARQEQDRVTLQLLNTHAPLNGIRVEAASLGEDTHTLKQVARAQQLFHRVRYLEALEPWEREEMAQNLGYGAGTQLRAAEPAQDDQHYEALKASGLYSL